MVISYYLFLPPYFCVVLFVDSFPFSGLNFCSAVFVTSVLISGLFRRHMEKKEQRERGFAGVGVDVDGVGMGRRQEVGVVEEEGMDEKYRGHDGGEVKDEFEKDVKVLERSVRSMEL